MGMMSLSLLPRHLLIRAQEIHLHLTTVAITGPCPQLTDDRHVLIGTVFVQHDFDTAERWLFALSILDRALDLFKCQHARSFCRFDAIPTLCFDIRFRQVGAAQHNDLHGLSARRLCRTAALLTSIACLLAFALTFSRAESQAARAANARTAAAKQ